MKETLRDKLTPPGHPTQGKLGTVVEQAKGFASLLALLLLSAGAPSPAAPAADGPAEPSPPVQIRVTLHHIVLPKGELAATLKADVREFLREGLVTGDPAEGVWQFIKRAGNSKEASSVGTLVVDTIQGIPLRFEQRSDRPLLAGSICPRLNKDLLAVDLDLVFGRKTGRIYTGQAIHETPTVSDGGLIALHFDASADFPFEEQVVFVRVTRVKP